MANFEQMDTPVDLEDRIGGLLGDDLSIERSQEAPAEAEAQEKAEPEAKADEAEHPNNDGKTEPTPTDEPKYKVKVNGQEMELPVSELIKGFQLQADYTRKTQQVAEERKAVEGEKEKLTREREEFVQQANTDMAVLRKQIEADAKVDWNALLESDPIGYMREKQAAEARRDQYFQLRQTQEQVVKALEQERQEGQAAYVAEQAGILAKELPDYFGDQAKSEATTKQLREFMQGIGYSEAEIANVSSAKDVKLLIKAMRYDQLERAKVEEQKKVQQQPARSESPRARVDDSGSPLNKAAMDRLKRSGGRDQDAAVSAIASLLG
ncbi:MAG TPA: hypothetical protein VFM34_05190 [Moraxellaceae bacterium]|nr:hypothetical protein [Moraxellaceae bacterium]